MAIDDKKPIGKTKDAGWQVGARRTLDITPGDAWRWVVSAEGMESWLGEGTAPSAENEQYTLADGANGEVRVYKPGSHIRVTWQPVGWPKASTIQVRVIPKGERSVIAFHQENMPGPEAREERKAFFLAILDGLEEKFRNKNG